MGQRGLRLQAAGLSSWVQGLGFRISGSGANGKGSPSLGFRLFQKDLSSLDVFLVPVDSHALPFCSFQACHVFWGNNFDDTTQNRN